MTEIESSERSLTIRRTFDAPRERVWEAWTDPDELAQWWGPADWTLSANDLEFREGGTWHFCMQSPDGDEAWGTVVYEEIVAPERIVAKDYFADEHGDRVDDTPELTLTVEFVDRGDATEVVLTHQGFRSDELSEMAEGGWTGSLDDLEAYLAADHEGVDDREDSQTTEAQRTNERGHEEDEMTTTDPDEPDIETTDTKLTIRRTIDAPPERVFAAFTDPEEMAQWYGHGAMDVEVHALEAEPGGSFSITMRDDESYDIEGEFLEVVENERIVHTWYVGTVTVDLAEAAGGTEIVFTHDGFPDRSITDQHAEGWIPAIDALATVVEERGGQEATEAND